MIRAAAKNHDDVAVVVDAVRLCARARPSWPRTTARTTLALRQRLAQKAYARTAAYDAAISNWFAGADRRDRARLPRASAARLPKPMRYGENPHQAAAFYRTPEQRPGVATARQVQGKAALLQQHQRHRRGLRMRRRVRSRAHGGGRHHQARQSLRRRGRARSLAEAYAARAALRSRVGLRRHRRAEPQARRRRRRARSSRSSPRSSSRPTPTRRRSPSSRAKKNLRLLLTGGLPDPRAQGLPLRTVAGGFLVQAPRQRASSTTWS